MPLDVNTSTPGSINALPLHELAAFEAAARLGSLVRAAEELSVTSSALSHRIASLQARLGVVLFERKGKGLQITPDGERYLASMQSSLHAMWARGDALRTQEHRVVRLVAAPAIATAWLLPQLTRLFDSDPGLRLEVSTAALPDDVAGLEWDLLVHYGVSTQDPAQRVPLFTDCLMPLCAPSLLPASGSPLALADFQKLPLLRHTLLLWSRWLEAAFSVRAEIEARAYFDDATSMLEAAAAGAGIALSTGMAARPYLEEGSLVVAHPHQLPDREFYAEISESGMLKPRARALLGWLETLAATQPGVLIR